MKYPKTLAATKTPEILAVIENLPVSANGFFMTAEQLDNVEAAIAANDTAAASLATANASLATATADLATANASLQTANDRIAVLEAQGVEPTSTTKEKDDFVIEHQKDAMEMTFQKELMDKVS